MSCCVCGSEDFEEGWQRWDDHPARRQWHVLKDLGTGAMSQVVLAQNIQSGEMAALKVVFLESPNVADDPDHLALLQRESDLLSMLDHPNIVECKDVIRSPRQLVLVLEWLRDIKPENVMFAEPPSEAKAAPLTAAQLQAGRPAGGAGGLAGQKMPTVKLVDLGMACLYDPAKPVTGPLGSPGFVAPEIIAGAPHAPSMDVFSLGVLLFIMLVGRKPFNIKESENLRYAVTPLQEAPGLKDPRWLDLSPDAKHLLMGMLAYDPARRLTMQQVLEHEWLVSRGGILPRPLGQDVVFGAATVASIRRLRNLCGGVVAFNRAAAAAGTKAGGCGKCGEGGNSSSKPGGMPSDSAKDAYLRRLKQSQRLDASTRRGGAMNRFAANLASSAYSRTHDAGDSIHPTADVSSRHGAAAARAALDASIASRRQGRLGLLRGAASQAVLRGGSVRSGSMHGPTNDPSASRRNRFTSMLPGGLTRAGTALMLSEMDRSSRQSLSRRGSIGKAPLAADATADEPASPKLQRGPSTLQLLTAAAKAYLDGSVHGSRRGALAFAAAAAAGGGGGGGSSSGGGSSGARQVADDSGASRRGQQQGLPGFQAQLAAIADGSGEGSSAGASGSTHSSGGLVEAEGRRRGSSDAALAVGATPRPGRAHSGLSPAGGGGAPSPLAGTLSAQSGMAAPLPAPRLPVGDLAGLSSAASDGSAPGPRASFQADPGARASFQADRANGSAAGSRSKFDGVASMDGVRAPVVVRRKSLDNPLMHPAAASPPPGRTWAEMQALLRHQSQQATPRTSRENMATGTPATRVVRLKPLE
ncbi:hypothetical protein ABPG75_005823 [Micractinium tetrahymenae]